ncbi:DUF4079 domain containing protein [Nitzschia inconspicua]|uniref:DUF4079 domain containing protein n=1 Tax=Nitzschia inconspicua TaxID=303405 RepID=A0A9K3PED9_9STRA|nr:DUF4079 domain containing protein [Nitzschia inconspicua]
MKVSFVLVSVLATTEAFVAPSVNRASFGSKTVGDFTGRIPRYLDPSDYNQDDCVHGELENPDLANVKSFDPIPALAAATIMFSSNAAFADSPDWGIFEGKTGSLLHPVMMFGMLALSISTALLGFEWRRQRTIGDEISVLKKQLPALGGAKTVSEALKAAKAAETPDTALIAKLQAAAPVDLEIKQLQDERKSLSEKGPRDKHYGQGAMLAFLGTIFAIEGPLNTYARAGKLFPGPHLYAGAGLVCLWALAVACVPQMQKGNEVARTVHIGANLAGIGMFLWQLQSGIPILLKVWELTKWP